MNGLRLNREVTIVDVVGGIGLLAGGIYTFFGIGAQINAVAAEQVHVKADVVRIERKIETVKTEAKERDADITKQLDKKFSEQNAAIVKTIDKLDVKLDQILLQR